MGPGTRGRPEPTMSVARSVAEVLRDRVRLEVEAIDRMYLNVYVPHLQSVGAVVGYLRVHRSQRFASTTAVTPMTEAFVRNIDQFVNTAGVDLVAFQKGQRKDDVTQKYLGRFAQHEGVLYVGKAQEKARVMRTERRRSRFTGGTYPWIVESTAMVNHYYFYCVDEDFGPFFLKFCSYFPYNAKLCLNGHEYLKQQLKQKGIAYQPLENGILSCQHPQALQALCDRLSEGKIDALLRKWLRRLPHPFAARDRQAGYRYQLSILQLELSLTQILDRPVSGRIFFEDVIRENLDIGRLKQIQLIFDRPIIKTTPGPFRTRVITDGVIPSLHIDYKGTRIKQYHKEGRALRTETTINNTYDFYIGKNLRNLPALRRIGFQANRRLLHVQRISHDCILAEETFQRINRPIRVASQRTSALHFADPQVQALWRALLLFQLLPAGFSNRDLRPHFASLLGQPTQNLSQGQMSYQLRRLRLHGIIERIPQTHRYRITNPGLRTLWFCTRTYSRLFRPGLASVLPQLSSANSRLRRSFDKLDQEVTTWIQRTKLAA